MPDDLKRRQPEDRTRINVPERWELDYWCRELGVTEQTLRTTVAKFGVGVAAVRRALGK